MQKTKLGRRGKIVAIIILSLIVVAFAIESFVEYYAAASVIENISGIGVSSIGPSNATVVFTITFICPSGCASPPFSADFAIYLAGTQIGTGGLPVTRADAGTSAVNQSLSITVSYSRVSLNIIEAVLPVNGTAQLAVRGTVHSKVLFDLVPISIPFATTSIPTTGD